jgi:hypothetical protein
LIPFKKNMAVFCGIGNIAAITKFSKLHRACSKN